jgi:TatD DNase family protein
MIDVHCHLEQKDFDEDRDELIEKCKKELDAIIISCTKPDNLEKCLEIASKYKGFVFLTIALHPIYIADFSNEEKKNYFEKIREYKKYFVGIGECGLDYHWVKDENLREKQKELFREHIKLAKELNLPLVVHSRNAEKECLDILREEKAEKVLLHFFASYKLADEIKKTNYFVSINTSILRSKGIRKILKVVGINRVMTETDSPWLGFGTRNTPLAVKLVIDKIAQLMKKNFGEVDKITTKNAITFFDLF